MSTHPAAIIPSKGHPLTLHSRPTPTPGPNDLLIAVKSLALNPADAIMRSTGLFITSYPTVLGFDLAGLVLSAGSAVPSSFQPGTTRVAAYAGSFHSGFAADYGAFQERCLVPWQHAFVLPEGLAWNEAATLPVAVEVPLSAWDAMGIPRLGEARAPAGSGLHKEEALLVWGASSSVGTMGVQTARLLREDAGSSFAAVYATAGAANMDYVRSLGADRVFSYNDPQIVNAIVSASKDDGLVIRHCFLAAGLLAPCQAVLRAFVSENVEGEKAKIASAPTVPEDAEVVDGVETIFSMPSTVEEERLEQFRYWYGTLLKENLAKGTLRPSPRPRIVGKGLDAINAGLDMLLQGVSCTKLVVELGE